MALLMCFGLTLLIIVGFMFIGFMDTGKFSVKINDPEAFVGFIFGYTALFMVIRWVFLGIRWAYRTSKLNA